MSAVSKFDTLASAEDLQKAGMPESQAKAIARAIASAITLDLSHLATKDDLTHAIEILRRDMTIRLGAMMIVAVGVILAGIKYLH